MRKIYVLTGVLLLCMCASLSAQTVKAKLKAIDEAWQNKNYFGVMQYIKILPEDKQKEPEMLDLYARAATNIFSYQEAARAYTELGITPFKVNYPMLDYELGLVQKYQGNYNEAIASFERFLAETAPNDINIKKANKEIDECLWAQTAIENSNTRKEVKHFDDRVNSPFTDFGAVYSGDTLYFSSLRFEKDRPSDKDIPSSAFFSRILVVPPDGEAEIWDTPFNTGETNVNAHLSFSTDRKRVYFNRCEYVNGNDMICHIYYSQRYTDNKWSPAKKLPENINMPQFTATQPSVGFDNARNTQIMYFASDRPGGEGETDIWYSLMDRDGNWADPVNAYEVNTPQGELTPFFHTPSQMLYFSTNGRRTFGGFDVYKSKKAGRKLGEPEHLAPPVNSSYHDWHYSVNSEATLGTFASNRTGGYYLDAATATCCNDIYEVTLDEPIFFLDLHAVNTVTNEKVESIDVIMTDGDGRSWTFRSDTVDMIEIPLIANREYTIVVSKEGFSTDTVDVVDTRGLTDDETFKRIAYLTPLRSPSLLALVFDGDADLPLLGARVDLLAVNENAVALSGVEPVWKRNYESNEFPFSVNQQTQYMLIATKEGYLSDTAFAMPSEFDNLSTDQLVKRLYLSRKPSTIPTLTEYMPLPLYFDNDYPDPDSRSKRTRTSYEDAYFAYLTRQQEYIDAYTANVPYEEKRKREQAMSAFFSEEVALGYETLKGFFRHLHEYLEAGNNVKLIIKSYASPRADSRYNLNLTHRRTRSLINYMRNYRKGIFVPYLSSGQLLILEKPYGETQAPSGISDRYEDEIGSIYSIEASRERRAEILEVLGGNGVR